MTARKVRLDKVLSTGWWWIVDPSSGLSVTPLRFRTAAEAAYHAENEGWDVMNLLTSVIEDPQPQSGASGPSPVTADMFEGLVHRVERLERNAARMVFTAGDGGSADAAVAKGVASTGAWPAHLHVREDDDVFVLLGLRQARCSCGWTSGTVESEESTRTAFDTHLSSSLAPLPRAPRVSHGRYAPSAPENTDPMESIRDLRQAAVVALAAAPYDHLASRVLRNVLRLLDAYVNQDRQESMSTADGDPAP